MSMMDVALASCRVLPERDPDERPLLAALEGAGLRAGSLGWDDPMADFGAARLTLLRATWNYPEQPARFLDWIERTARVSTVVNAPEVVRWNIHKGYLLELGGAGVPVVPTVLVPRGELTPLDQLARQHGFDDVVIKPAVSCGSRETRRFRAHERAAGEAHLRSLVASEDALIQPYLPAVEGYGERALVWIDGEVTHAVRKSPRFADGQEWISETVPVSPAELALAQAAIAAAPPSLLYARIDIVPGPDGDPLLMELELIEPSLFFALSERALARFTAGVLARLRALDAR